MAIQTEMLRLEENRFLETIENCSKRFGTMLVKEDFVSNIILFAWFRCFSGFAEARLFLYREGQNEIENNDLDFWHRVASLCVYFFNYILLYFIITNNYWILLLLFLLLFCGIVVLFYTLQYKTNTNLIGVVAYELMSPEYQMPSSTTFADVWIANHR